MAPFNFILNKFELVFTTLERFAVHFSKIKILYRT